ncbi:MAG: TolC family protein [candidate division KSB1 bacterium]|nr:TolC family protein [candidate division KSB1 bacterium]
MKHSMMKISWMFITILLLAGVARARQLQENPMADTSAVANLSEIIEIALKENPGIRSAEKRYRALLAVPAQVSSLPDPVLGYTRWVKNVETRVGPQENVFVLSQRIPFPGKLGLKGKIALQDAEAARQDYEAARRDVLFKVKSTYADLYNIDQSLRILRTYKRILRDFADVAATKYATGSGIQAQVLKAQVEISTIEVKELAFEKRRTGVVARLNALMNRSADAPIGTAVDIDLPPVTLAEQQLLAIARERRQELKATKYMIEKASFAKKLARKNYLPDFNFQTTYISIPKVNGMFQDSGKDAFSVMLGINLPIWLGPRRAAVEQATEMQIARQYQYDNLWKTVEAEIADILFQLKTLRETLDLYEQGLLVQAETSLESALSAYKTGKLDFLNLLDAERMLLQLRLAYAREQANYFKQYAALEKAVGQPFNSQE